MGQNTALPKLFIEIDPAINQRLHAAVKRAATSKRAVVEAALNTYLAMKEYEAATTPKSPAQVSA